MENIPKFFWIVLSICILSLTSLTVFLAVRSDNISLKYSNMQIDFAKKEAQQLVAEAEILVMKKNLKAITAKLKERETEILNHQNALSRKLATPKKYDIPLKDLQKSPMVLPSWNKKQILNDGNWADKIEEKLDKINPQIDRPSAN